MTLVYCIGCKSQILAKDAKMVMKTGYYKRVVPLAVCHCCSDRLMAAAGV